MAETDTPVATDTTTSGIIELDSPFGREIGFTSDKWGAMSYLWREDTRVLVSAILSLDSGKGNLSRLFAAIEAKGLRVSVPTPLWHMEEILKRKGFAPHTEGDPDMGDVEVWERVA